MILLVQAEGDNMKSEYKEYLKKAYNVDIDNMSNEEVTEFLITVIKKNEKLIRLEEEKNSILKDEFNELL